MTDCLFCKIIAGQIPSTKVAENDVAVAFRDVNPQAPTHILVVPRQHVASMNEASDPALLGKLLLLTRDLARKEGIADAGYRVVVNTNAAGGQTVFHLHVHLLGGRGMRWPPG
jgi:histidine triad (HIT) family protein